MSHKTPNIAVSNNFFNRELSLLSFQRRVLLQAADQSCPLLERLKFISIVSSNLDEFFEIRVAGLKEAALLGENTKGIDGFTKTEILEKVGQETHDLIDRQHNMLYDELFPALEQEGVCFLTINNHSAWTQAQQQWMHQYFMNEVFPVLTPIALDPAHPFPRVLNKSLNFAVELDGEDAFGRFCPSAIVQAPRLLPRIIRVPEEISETPYTFIFLSTIIHIFVGELFYGLTVRGCHQFRITRNSDLYFDQDEVEDLMTTVQGGLHQRHFGNAVRLEISQDCPEYLVRSLMKHFSLLETDVYRVRGLVNLGRVMQLYDSINLPHLKDQPFTRTMPQEFDKQVNIFENISRRDILIHHPYQSFNLVVDLLEEAVEDPNVVAIKITVYRAGSSSELMDALVKAAKKGKEVTVIVELMARFDEEANINWAARLERAGAHIVYGVFGYKTHAKMLMLVRREQNKLKRYVHLGTGNYHTKTAKLYTDFGLLTANDEMGSDVNEIFQQLTGLSKSTALQYLWQAPFTLHKNVIAAINKEAEQAALGQKSRIIAKMNSLTEPETVEALYRASQAGVKIDLIIRGACILRPGIEGLSENIRVISVVGRFLEHHRIFYFHNEGKLAVYLSSADWMDRNFFRRIELAFPILDNELKKRVIHEGLMLYLDDNSRAWDMDSEGSYTLRCPKEDEAPKCAQDILLEELAKITREMPATLTPQFEQRPG